MAKKKRKSAQAAQAAQVEQTGLMGKFEELKKFFEESKVEIKKVVWPSRKETLVTCGAVLILVVVMSIFLSLVDMGISSLVQVILS